MHSRVAPLAPLVLAVVLIPSFAHASADVANGEIAFSTLVHGTSQVFTVNPDGTRLRQVTHRARGAGQFGLSWSPDGTGLLFTVTDQEGRDTIARSRADGSDVTQLTQKATPTTAEDHQPQWSPDGTEIAFVRVNTTTAPANEGAIEVMSPDGSDVRRLTPLAIDATDPHWSPDGKSILFNTYREPVHGESANLYTMHADGTHRTALTHYAGGSLQAFADDWSPDGAQIVFHRVTYSGTDTQRGGFYRIDSDGKHIRRLATTPVTSDSARATWGARTR
jgi:Tol biopolymer transport system component